MCVRNSHVPGYLIFLFTKYGNNIETNTGKIFSKIPLISPPIP